MPTSPLFRLKPLSLALLLALAGCSDADRSDPVVETQAPELEQAATEKD